MKNRCRAQAGSVVVTVCALFLAVPGNAQPNPVCTQAQCKELGDAGKFCGAWGPNAAPYACANSGGTNFGGCNADANYWTSTNCVAETCKSDCVALGCNTSVCNWNAIIPHGLPPASADRTLKFKNECPFNIRVGYVGGALKDANLAIIECQTDSSVCPSGTQCMQSTVAGASYCYWQMPQAFAAARNLGPKKSSSVTLKNPSAPFANNIQVKWSGNVWAHGQCDASFGNCKTAICTGDGCAANFGPSGPVTLAEFTLQNNSQDYYDISVINGINLPIMMAPSVGDGDVSLYPPTGNAGQYWCGAPGSAEASGGLKEATWNVGANAPRADLVTYRYVDPTGFAQSCTTTDDPVCTGGSVCGLSYTENTKNTWVTRNQCGTLIGWWTAAEICGVDSQAKFGNIDCSKTLSSHQGCSYAGNPTQSDLLLCTGGTFGLSCYAANATSCGCCGCENWNGVTATGSCTSSNPDWQKYSLPWLMPLKSAVSTAYSYPFDDMTSTFNCYVEAADKISQPAPQQANQTDYTITFCPGGLSVPAMQ